jgi:hypothetical protein
MRAAAWGAAAGLVVAAVILGLAAAWLLRSGGADERVLIAVWLWALPVAGACAAAGYAAGFGLRLLGSSLGAAARTKRR